MRKSCCYMALNFIFLAPFGICGNHAFYICRLIRRYRLRARGSARIEWVTGSLVYSATLTVSQCVDDKRAIVFVSVQPGRISHLTSHRTRVCESMHRIQFPGYL
jgi:hypothetical protein